MLERQTNFRSILLSNQNCCKYSTTVCFEWLPSNTWWKETGESSDSQIVRWGAGSQNYSDSSCFTSTRLCELDPAPVGRQVVKSELVPSISHETIRQTLKKMAWQSKNPVLGDSTRKRCWIRCQYGRSFRNIWKAIQCFSPCCLYGWQPVQLIRESRQPVPATESHPLRVDYEYERNGTASIFMFTEPLSGWREAIARSHRTKVDWQLKSPKYLRGVMPTVRKSLWYVIISIHTRRGRFMKRLSQIVPCSCPQDWILLYAQAR